MKYYSVKDKITGEVIRAHYGVNRLGNKRMWVNGKFYSDHDFNRRFEILEIVTA